MKNTIYTPAAKYEPSDQRTRPQNILKTQMIEQAVGQ